MKIQQYIHQLNNSELGRTGVHESYVSVPRGMAPALKFIKEGEIKAVFKRNGATHKLKFKKYDNGEFRLTGLGELYRTSNVHAGDLIVLEGVNGGLWIDIIYRTNLIVFGAQGQYRFECRNEDRIHPYLNIDIACYKDGSSVMLRIVPKGTIKPRSDSKREVNLYEIQADGHGISSVRNQALNLFFFRGGNFLVPSSPDAIHELEWSDYE